MLSHRSLKIPSLLNNFFAILFGWVPLASLPGPWSFLLVHLVFWWTPLAYFSAQLLYSVIQLQLPFVTFLYFLFVEGLIFMTITLNSFSSVQSLSCVQLFATPWIAACQASLSITNSRSSLRLTSSESVMPSSHLTLCSPLLLLPPIPPSIRVFSNESTLYMRWPKYWSFSFSIISSKEIPGIS